MYKEFDQTCTNTEQKQFLSSVKKVLIVISYKKWNDNIIPVDVAEDWEIFVITKESFGLLYGPTLNGLAQFYSNTIKDKN